MMGERILGFSLAAASALLGFTAAIGAQSTGDAAKSLHNGSEAAGMIAPPAVRQRQMASNTDLNGDEVYAQNCSRCHTAPEALRHRITGTVLMHMRVRANLSAADEKALLKFFNGQ